MAVKNNCAVCIYPCQAIAIIIQTFQITFAKLLRRISGKAQFIFQLRLLHTTKVRIQNTDNDDKTGKQHGNGHREDGLEDFTSHSQPPSDSPHCARFQSSCRSRPISGAKYGYGNPEYGNHPCNPVSTPERTTAPWYKPFRDEKGTSEAIQILCK